MNSPSAHKPKPAVSITIRFPSNPSTLGIELECQTGFYVRAFASELAYSMGDKGYACHIKRLKIGEFSMDCSVDYENILDFSSINDLSTNLITI